ncbi:MAG TPA: PAC2 family protein [Nitrososphaeraceae archaeon]|nr:PAC2 family protein [Nitrososphaeraceae archaeon]
MISYSKPIDVVYSQKKLPSLRSPSLICGLPGTGFVGKVAIDYLIKELDAVHLADIYSTFFSPQIIIKQDGTSEIVKNSVYYVKRENKKSKNTTIKTQPLQENSQDISSSVKSKSVNILEPASSDLLLLTGDSQPIVPGSEYVLTEQILDDMTKFDISNIYSLAAYVTGAFTNTPKIYGTATATKLVGLFRNHNVSSLDNGNITGMNGIIIGLGKLRGIDGFCLLGETSGYVIDAIAAKKILETITRILNIHINMDEITKRAKDTEILIKNLEQQMLAKSNQGAQSLMGEERQDEERQFFSQNRRSNMGYIS